MIFDKSNRNSLKFWYAWTATQKASMCLNLNVKIKDQRQIFFESHDKPNSKMILVVNKP